MYDKQHAVDQNQLIHMHLCLKHDVFQFFLLQAMLKDVLENEVVVTYDTGYSTSRFYQLSSILIMVLNFRVEKKLPFKDVRLPPKQSSNLQLDQGQEVEVNYSLDSPVLCVK